MSLECSAKIFKAIANGGILSIYIDRYIDRYIYISVSKWDKRLKTCQTVLGSIIGHNSVSKCLQTLDKQMS